MYSSWGLKVAGPRFTARVDRPRVEVLEARELPATQLYATGPGEGGGPHVIVRNAADQLVAQFFAYDAEFIGGVDTAIGDVTGDGQVDVVTGAGPGGGPHVKVFDGAALLAGQIVEVRSFYAYDAGFAGGVSVAAGDYNGDDRCDIITGAGAGGGPHVKAFSGSEPFINSLPDASLLASFMAYDIGFTGGVSVAADDIGGDNGGSAGGIGKAEIITGAGPGGGPHVKAFSFNPDLGSVNSEFVSFMAYDIGFTGGVFVGTGFVTNNRDPDNFRYADIITGAGPGGGPHVKVWRVVDFINNAQGITITYLYAEVASFYAFDADDTRGVRVAADRRSGTIDSIVTTVGPGAEPPAVLVYSGQNLGDDQTYVPTLLSAYVAYDDEFHGGVFVGSGQELTAAGAAP